MKALITGGSGYIGLNLARTLLAAGHEVVCMDRVRSPNLDARATFAPGDIFDDTSLDRLLEGVDVVFHLVAKITLAQEDAMAWRINTEGVRRVAEAALRQRVRRMVHVSSCASFDQVQCKGYLSETSPRVIDPTVPVYGRSKYAGELELLKVVEKGLDGVICYPTGVMGPIDHGPVISRINAVLLDAARGKVPAMVRGSFDLDDVRDVTHGLLLASERGRTGENYLLGGHYMDMADACRRAAAYVGRPGPKLTLPMGLVKAMAPTISFLTGQSQNPDNPMSKYALETIETSPRVDRSKAGRELGYVPRPFEESLRDLMAFFVETGAFRAGRLAPTAHAA